MKKTTIFFRLTLLLLLPIVVCCTQESIEDQLPPITQTGANTFAFVYDGVVFTPTGSNSRGFGIDGSGASGLSVYGDYIGTEHYSNRIQADRYTSIKNVKFIYIHLYKLDSVGLGTYILEAYNSRGGGKQPYNSYISMYAKSPSSGEWVMYYSYENSGEIIITRQGSGDGVSGTFSGKLKSWNSSEIVEISQGRFDINYKTYEDKEYK